MINREVLASKQLSPELSDIMNDVVAAVNYIKTRALKTQLFFCVVRGNGLRPHSCFVSQRSSVAVTLESPILFLHRWTI